LSHPPPDLRRRKKKPGLAELNPYSLDHNGWCDPTDHRAHAYERGGPPADPRANVHGPRTKSGRLDIALVNGAPSVAVAVEKLYAQWAEHARKDVVASLFPPLNSVPRRTSLRREVGKVRVRSARGDVVDLAAKVRDCRALSPVAAQRIMDVIVDLRHAWKTRDIALDGVDAGYDEINWRHVCQEVGQILDGAEASLLTAEETEDAVLASLFSDAAKLKHNFITHHIDGAVAAAFVLPRFLDVTTHAGRLRVVAICQAILEHQVGPPRFMAQMVRSALSAGALAAKNAHAKASELDAIHAKIADPLKHVTLHADGYGVLDVDARESELLASVGLPAWYVPHQGTPWFKASRAVIDADSLVNYVTPDGVGKIVAICGPGTSFQDPTVFHSIFSCGASFVDAVSVMSDTAMPALREGVEQTRAAIDDVRARILVELEEGWLHFAPAEFRKIVREEGVDVDKLTSTRREGEILVDVPWQDAGQLPYWNTALDYAANDAAFEFAKLIRRRVADLLREA
jgi:hypothetical protein